MCGRARCSLQRSSVLAAAHVPSEARWRDADAYEPHYNVMPGTYLPVLRLGHDGQRELVSMK
jgi:putative SOS response-associated peptidase YedK